METWRGFAPENFPRAPMAPTVLVLTVCKAPACTAYETLIDRRKFQRAPAIAFRKSPKTKNAALSIAS